MNPLEPILEKIRHFRDERNWMQFHNPKDLAAALSIEAGELLEIFLWKSAEEVEATVTAKRERLEEEIADVGVYLIELADILQIDLLKAMEKKIAKNALKYPVATARGSNAKYDEL